MIQRKKEAASDVSGIGDGKRMIQTTIFPKSDSTMQSEEKQETFAIANLLPVGRENAIRGWYLAELLQTDQRTVVEMIRKDRLKGAAICSDSKGGYYLADEADDLIRSADSLKSRGIKCIEVASAMDKTATRMQEEASECAEI